MLKLDNPVFRGYVTDLRDAAKDLGELADVELIEEKEIPAGKVLELALVLKLRAQDVIDYTNSN